jgi:hypothetical protein
LRGFPRCGRGFLVAGRSHCEATIREADPEHSAPCRGNGKPSALRHCSRVCGRMSPVYEAEAEPATEAEPPCSLAGIWFSLRARPCSHRWRRHFFCWFRVWGFGLRLGLWKSGKRIVEAERSGSGAEAEHHPPRRGFSRCGGFLVAAGVSSLRDGAIAKRPSAVGHRDSHGERLQREARPAGTGEPLPLWDYKERRGCCGAFLVAETEA